MTTGKTQLLPCIVETSVIDRIYSRKYCVNTILSDICQIFVSRRTWHGSESFNNIDIGANRHRLARIKSPCIIILLPTPCLTYHVSIFTSLDHEEALFNPNCRILHLLEDIKRRCNCAENGLLLVWVKLLVLFCAQIATSIKHTCEPT